MRTKKTIFFLLAGALLSYFTFDKIALPPAVGGWKIGLKTVSFLISPLLNAFLWPALFLFQYVRKKGWFLCYIATSVGVSYIVTCLIKVGLGRARPFLEAGFHPLTLNTAYHSCPSGHATIAMAMAAAASNLFPSQKKLWLTLGFLTPGVRVLLGKHFLSDVLLGEAIGYALATLVLGRVSHTIYQIFGKLTGVKSYDR